MPPLWTEPGLPFILEGGGDANRTRSRIWTDAKMKEMIAVEVERTGGMMPSPARRLVALGWSTRPRDAGPARSLEGTAFHGRNPVVERGDRCRRHASVNPWRPGRSY